MAQAPTSPRATVTLLSGNKMPALALGTWELKHDTPGAVENALRSGFAMIDTSGDYGTQPGIGEGLKKSGINREDVYIVTKVEEDDNSYEATKKDLKELGTDHADLMLIHRPPKKGVGAELWRGLQKARDEGLTKDIGVSNYSTSQIDELIKEVGETPVVNQIEWSPFGHDAEMLEYTKNRGIMIMAYSPLTRGTRLDDPRLKAITEKYDKTPAQILVRWNMQLGTVPIVKANKSEHQKEDLNVFDFELSREDMQELEKMNEHYSALGELPYIENK